MMRPPARRGSTFAWHRAFGASSYRRRLRRTHRALLLPLVVLAAKTYGVRSVGHDPSGTIRRARSAGHDPPGTVSAPAPGTAVERTPRPTGPLSWREVSEKQYRPQS